MVGLDDVGVDEVRDEARLPDEVVLELLDRGVLLADELHRDDLPEVARSQLHGLVHDPHAALRQLAGHLVVQFIEDVLEGCHGGEVIRLVRSRQGNILESARNLLRRSLTAVWAGLISTR